MRNLAENALKDMNSSQILGQGFLRCKSSENISEQNPVQQAFFNKIQIVDAEPIDAIDRTLIVSQKKTESVISEKSLPAIEGKFKKRDAENIQRIKQMTQILTTYNPDFFSFDLHFNGILSTFKKLKSSSSKLAAFLYVLDSTKDKEDAKIQTNNKKLYKELPRKYKKIIKKSNPKFSADMRSNESLKSMESIRIHLKKRSIFV